MFHAAKETHRLLMTARRLDQRGDKRLHSTDAKRTCGRRRWMRASISAAFAGTLLTVGHSSRSLLVAVAVRHSAF